jgi:hypothetical protein
MWSRKKRERDHGGTGQPRAAEEEVGYGDSVRSEEGEKSKLSRPKTGAE